MGNVTFTFAGSRQWTQALSQWGDEILDEATRELQDEAPILKGDLQAAAPMAADAHHGHPPGTLRKGITVKVERQRGGMVLVAKSTAPHTHLVELGTRKMAPQPFFVPTAIRARARFTRYVREILAKPRAAVGDGSPIVVETASGGTGI